MATELVHWCDWHISDESASRVVGTAHHVVVVDGAEYTLDLCEECDVKRLDPLVSFVSLVGVRTNVPTRKRRAEAHAENAEDTPRPRVRNSGKRHPDDDGVTVVCPICGQVTGARPGLAAHGIRAHGTGTLVSLFEEARSRRGGEGALMPAPGVLDVDQ